MGGQLEKGGILSPLGEGVSKEGFNRAQRGETGTEGAQKQGKGWGESLSGGLVGGSGKK